MRREEWYTRTGGRSYMWVPGRGGGKYGTYLNGPASTLYGVPDRLLGTVRSVWVETRATCRGDLQWTPPTPPINSPPHAPPPRPGLYTQRPSNTLGWPLMPEVLRSGGRYDRYRCPSVQCSGLKPHARSTSKAHGKFGLYATRYIGPAGGAHTLKV